MKLYVNKLLSVELREQEYAISNPGSGNGDFDNEVVVPSRQLDTLINILKIVQHAGRVGASLEAGLFSYQDKVYTKVKQGKYLLISSVDGYLCTNIVHARVLNESLMVAWPPNPYQEA